MIDRWIYLSNKKARNMSEEVIFPDVQDELKRIRTENHAALDQIVLTCNSRNLGKRAQWITR